MKIADQARALARKINVPTLVIHSKRDKATKYKITREISTSLKAAGKDIRLVTLRKSNHLILWDYESEQVENLILNFVDGKES